MILLIKNVRQLLWHLYVDTAEEDSELHCYDIEGDKNADVSQASCRMDGIRRLPHRWQRTVDALRDCFEGL